MGMPVRVDMGARALHGVIGAEDERHGVEQIDVGGLAVVAGFLVSFWGARGMMHLMVRPRTVSLDEWGGVGENEAARSFGISGPEVKRAQTDDDVVCGPVDADADDDGCGSAGERGKGSAGG